MELRLPPYTKVPVPSQYSKDTHFFYQSWFSPSSNCYWFQPIHEEMFANLWWICVSCLLGFWLFPLCHYIDFSLCCAFQFSYWALHIGNLWSEFFSFFFFLAGNLIYCLLHSVTNHLKSSSGRQESSHEFGVLPRHSLLTIRAGGDTPLLHCATV